MMKFVIIFSVISLFVSSEAMVNSVLVDNMPFNAYVVFRDQQGQGFYGGGCFVSSMHVLTSGANVFGFTAWQIGFGSNRRTNHTTVVAFRGVAHPNYSATNNFRLNDIGMIFLTQPVTLSSSVSPIFFSWKQDRQMADENIQGMVLGYAPAVIQGSEGMNELQAAHIRVIDEISCRGVFPEFNALQHFCGVDDRRSNFCMGDQGGPLTVVSRGTEILIGIASMPGCERGPSSYTRIENYKEWILEQISSTV